MTLIVRARQRHQDAIPFNQEHAEMNITHLIGVKNGIAYYGTGWMFEIPHDYEMSIRSGYSCIEQGWTVIHCSNNIEGELVIALQPISSIAARIGILLSRSDDIYGVTVPHEDEITQHLVNITSLPLNIGEFSLTRKTPYDINILSSQSIN